MLNRRTRVSLTFALAAAGAAAVVGCNANPAPPGAMASGGQCFLPANVNSFSANADGTVDIQVGASQYYRLTLGAGCPEINWAFQVGIRSTGGGNFVCSGYDAELFVPDPAMGTQRCPVTNIVQITKEQYTMAKRK